LGDCTAYYGMNIEPLCAAHADTRRTTRLAGDHAPPRPSPPPRAEKKITRHRAADFAALHAFALANSRRSELRYPPPRLLPTPTRAEEHLAVTPGCRPRSPDAKGRQQRLVSVAHPRSSCVVAVGFYPPSSPPFFSLLRRGACSTRGRAIRVESGPFVMHLVRGAGSSTSSARCAL